MTQVLFLKPDKSGKAREVQVIRSWQDAKGAQIYLHTNGVYGYKDASPVAKESEFEIIADPIQKRLALKWWNAYGREFSEEFYRQKKEAMEAAQEAEVPLVMGDSSSLDAALYRRRKGEKGKWSDASTWYTWFKARPEWWGHAGLIEIAGHRYELMELAVPGQAPEAEGQAPDPNKKSTAQAGGF